MRLNLTGRQLQLLNEAVFEAYDLMTFQQMLAFRLGLRLDRFAATNLPFEHVVFQTITRAQAEGWTSELLIEAAAYRPKDAKLYELAGKLGVNASLTEGDTNDFLQSLLTPEEGIPNLAQVLAALMRLQRQVCRIEIDGKAKGTGFLVGPDRVLTNHHVVARVLNGDVSPAQVKVRFDYWHAQPLGQKPSGATYPLSGASAAEAIPCWSPPTDDERRGRASATPPDGAFLDYALLKVGGSPGAAAVNAVASQAKGAAEWSPEERGWIVASDPPSEPEADATLFILQHPEGGPLSIAWKSPGVIAVNATKTRVTYRNNTSPGSSGSPCFNGHFQIVALHHSGNLMQPGDAQSTLGNEGIPIKAVVEALRSRGETVAFFAAD